MRGLICGPKLAACGIVLSMWGVVMLVSVEILLCCVVMRHLNSCYEVTVHSVT